MGQISLRHPSHVTVTTLRLNGIIEKSREHGFGAVMYKLPRKPVEINERPSLGFTAKRRVAQSCIRREISYARLFSVPHYYVPRPSPEVAQ